MCVSKTENSKQIETSFGLETNGIFSSYDENTKRLIDKYEIGLTKYEYFLILKNNLIKIFFRYTIFICVCSVENKNFTYLFDQTSVV